MDKLIFYTNPQSRGRIVHWMLEETGVPYETVWMDFGPSMKTSEYLSINPMGKVPALKDGDTVVTEAPAICAYLADRFPEKISLRRRGIRHGRHTIAGSFSLPAPSKWP